MTTVDIHLGLPMAENGICACWNGNNVNEDIMNAVIYKDECTRSFDTPKSEHGLNVCLKDFNGSGNCSYVSKLLGKEVSFQSHTQTHHQNTGYCLYLNIKKVLKPQDEGLGGEKKEITKIAIGMPGGVDAEADKYDTQVIVGCVKCKHRLDHTHPMIEPIITSIMLKQSAGFDNQVSEWELKLETCPHTRNLDQSQAKPIATKAMAHCQECDLRSNLWLCLQCGHLGCGRKYHDGSGGNNHGVDHFKETGHCVNLKLGTITPEGTASIHCYSCDDEVLDDKLAEHLKVLGIDVKSQTKTEQSISEMELKANLNLTLSKVIEEGKVLIPVFGQDLTGMENLGNTCYMNSVVQVLFSLDEFKNFFIPRAISHIKNSKKFSPECIHTQIGKLALGLHSGHYSQKKLAEKTEFEGQEENKDQQQVDEYYQDGIRPQIFKTLIGKGHPEFQTGQQQDAQEYWSYFLEKIEKAMKASKQQDPGDVFKFELEDKLKCMTCNGVKFRKSEEQLLNLNVPIDPKTAEKDTKVEFSECLKSFFEPRIQDQVHCPQCKEKRDFLRTPRLLSCPRHLPIVLRRFTFEDWVPKKLEVDIQVEENINLSQYRAQEGQLGDGEHLLKEDDDTMEEVEEEPELNQELLQMIQGMGIPELQAKHALYNTGNNSAEVAVAWYFENMDNPTIQVPLLVKKQKGPKKDDGNKSGGFQPNPEALAMLVSMGMPERECLRALRKNNNNLEIASGWIFEHMGEPDSDEEMTVDSQAQNKEEFEEMTFQDDPSTYKGGYTLESFITHLGASVHAGHYVCHIKKDGKWIYFNDAKVAETNDPPIGKGYMYILKRQE